jgi:hypothetical protein
MKSSGTVAIHQPNFLPWLGFFRKWALADVFVLLDDVQIQRTGGGWTNRTAVIYGGSKNWLSVPIKRAGANEQKISDALMVDDPWWKKKILSSFRHGYSKCSHFEEAMPLLEQTLESENRNLLQMNLNGLRLVGQSLGLDASGLEFSSTLDLESRGTQRLIDIVTGFGGIKYLSGDGAEGYQKDELFANNGVALEPLNFVPPIYKQKGQEGFIPGLSVLDAIANVGIEKTREMILNGS